MQTDQKTIPNRPDVRPGQFGTSLRPGRIRLAAKAALKNATAKHCLLRRTCATGIALSHCPCHYFAAHCGHDQNYHHKRGRHRFCGDGWVFRLRLPSRCRPASPGAVVVVIFPASLDGASVRLEDPNPVGRRGYPPPPPRSHSHRPSLQPNLGIRGGGYVVVD